MSPVSPFQRASDNNRVAFLTELLHGANARLAAARAGLARGTVYRWKLEDPEFAGLWAEIMAARPRRRNLRRRVLGPRVIEPKRSLDSSHLASHVPPSSHPPKALWDVALAPVRGSRP